jgi:hypothetical protein
VILGVDQTASVYLVQGDVETGRGYVIWQDSDPLSAVTLGKFLARLRGDEILVSSESGTGTLVVSERAPKEPDERISIPDSRLCRLMGNRLSVLPCGRFRP